MSNTVNNSHLCSSISDVLELADNLIISRLARVSLLDPKKKNFDEQRRGLLNDLDISLAAYKEYDPESYVRALKLCVHYRHQKTQK